MPQIVSASAAAGEAGQYKPVFTATATATVSTVARLAPPARLDAHPPCCTLCGKPSTRTRCGGCSLLVVFPPAPAMPVAVRIEAISDTDRAKLHIPWSETFAITLSTGVALATNEDVPRGVDPEVFAARIADNRGAAYVGCGDLVFVLTDGGWTSDHAIRDDEDQDDGDVHNRHLSLLPVIRVPHRARRAVA